MKKLCSSILSADFSKLKDEVSEVENAGADIIHCDIMDGHFVPNITFGPGIVKAVSLVTSLPLDVHLMINNPEKYISDFHKAGASYISVHFENNAHLNRLIFQIKDLGIKAGVAINPATPVKFLENIIQYADFILLMSVNPGFGGQSFITDSLTKLKELKELIAEKNPACLIEIDGGVTLENIKEISDAGADMLVCGASVFKAPDRKSVIRQMKKIIS